MLYEILAAANQEHIASCVVSRDAVYGVAFFVVLERVVAVEIRDLRQIRVHLVHCPLAFAHRIVRILKTI